MKKAVSIKKKTKSIPRKMKNVMMFRRALTIESERGCALLAGAYVDAELEKLLIKKLIDDGKAIKEFFRPDGPMGSFYARIELAYLLGLIGNSARQDLHILRKIRNEFGHSVAPITFKYQPISSRLSKTRHINIDDRARQRHRFTNTVMGLLGVIHHTHRGCRKIKSKSDEYLNSEFVKIGNEIYKEMMKIFKEKGDNP